ncbi:MAG: hypothetical protein DWQ01_01165 [Planctomycetota bacterium]|nr:MAG: hypothetical protein DWQ01_01165 [Planctomycetota bacterium]
MPTFKDWPRVHQPKPEATLWRYLTAGKLEDFLATSTLYLCRVDRFDDSFEGSIGKAGADYKRKLLREFAQPGQDSSYYSAVLSARESFRRFFYASCWHLREHEAVSMWNSYLRGEPGAAIRTTFGRLRDAVPGSEPGRLIGGLVNYVDYDRKLFDMLGPIDAYFFKRIEYSEEREYRFLYHHLPMEVYPKDARRMFWLQEQGIASSVRFDPRDMNLEVETPDHYRHPVDLASLIESIVLAPTTEPKFEDHVRNLVNNAGLSCKILPSALSKKAEF